MKNVFVKLFFLFIVSILGANAHINAQSGQKQSEGAMFQMIKVSSPDSDFKKMNI